MTGQKIPDEIERWEKKGLREDIDTDAEHVHDIYVWKNLAVEHETYGEDDVGHWNAYVILDGHPMKLDKGYFDSFEEAVGYLKACMRRKELVGADKCDSDDDDMGIPEHPSGDHVARKSCPSFDTILAMMRGDEGGMEAYRRELAEIRKSADEDENENEAKPEPEVEPEAEPEAELTGDTINFDTPAKVNNPEQKVTVSGEQKTPAGKAYAAFGHDITGRRVAAPPPGEKTDLGGYLEKVSMSDKPSAGNIWIKGRSLSTSPVSKFVNNNFPKLLSKMRDAYNSRLKDTAVAPLPDKLEDMSVRQLRQLVMNEYQYKDPLGKLTYYNGQEGHGVPIIGGIQYAMPKDDGGYWSPIKEDGTLNPRSFVMLADESQVPGVLLHRNSTGFFNPVFGGMRQSGTSVDTSDARNDAISARNEALERWKANVFDPFMERNPTGGPTGGPSDDEFGIFASELAEQDPDYINATDDVSKEVAWKRAYRKAMDEGKDAWKIYQSQARLAKPTLKTDDKELKKQDAKERKDAENALKMNLNDTDMWYLDSTQQLPPEDMILGALSQAGIRANPDPGEESFDDAELTRRVLEKFGKFDENGNAIDGYTGDPEMTPEVRQKLIDQYSNIDPETGARRLNESGAKRMWAMDQIRGERMQKLIDRIEPLMIHWMDNAPIREVMALFEKYPALRRNTALTDEARKVYYKNLFDDFKVRNLWNGEGNPIDEWKNYIYRGKESTADKRTREEINQDVERESGIHYKGKNARKNTSQTGGGASDYTLTPEQQEAMKDLVKKKGGDFTVDRDTSKDNNVYRGDTVKKASESFIDRIKYFDPLFDTGMSKGDDMEDIPEGKKDTNPRIAAFRTISMGEGKDSVFPMTIVDKTTGKVLLTWDGKI